MLCDMREKGQIWADGESIYRTEVPRSDPPSIPRRTSWEVYSTRHPASIQGDQGPEDKLFGAIGRELCPEGARNMGMRTGRLAAVVFVAALCILVPVPLHSHAAAAAVPVLDAEVMDGEYAHSASFSSGAFNLLWQVEGDPAFFAMVARTGGYLGVGFEPGARDEGRGHGGRMGGANGSAFVHDSYSMDSFAPGVHGPGPWRYRRPSRLLRTDA